MNIYILGGGCYGRQYTHWLLLAKKRQKITFDKLIIVDQNPDCLVAQNTKGTKVIIQESDWISFLADYIRHSSQATTDQFVPSHAAPHLLGITFLSLIEAENRKDRKIFVELTDIKPSVKTPFESRLEIGVRTLSYATWKCPANCIEPDTCPRKHAPRDWDLEDTLKKWQKTSDLNALLIFPAKHFAFAVSTIPAKIVIERWLSLKKLLQNSGDYMIGIATTSACHGILSTFKIRVS